MMRNITAVIYDFKRSLMKKSVILVMAISILLGIGLSYVLYASLLQGMNLDDINVRAYMIAINNKIYLLGAVYDSKGDPINNAVAKLYLGDNPLIEASSDVKGLFFAEKEINLSDILRADLSFLRLTLYVGGKSINTSAEIRQFSTTPSMRSLRDGLYVVVELYRDSVYVLGRSTIFGAISTNSSLQPNDVFLSFTVLHRNNDVYKIMIFGIRVVNNSITPINTNILYTVANRSIFIQEIVNMTPAPRINIIIQRSITLKPSVFEKLRFEYLTNMTDYVEIKEIKLSGESKDLDTLILKVPFSDNTYVFTAGIIYRYSPLYTTLIMSLSSSGGIFFFTLSIVVLFLVNSMMAKPRSSGELEYILSKPLTRDDLYLIRYASILLAILFMVLILLLTLSSFTYVLLKISYDFDTLLRLFIGLTGSLIALLSLFYSIATGLRSGLYMGVSIGLFVILIFLWDSLMFAVGIALSGTQSFQEISKFVEESTYFNPRVLVRYVFSELASTFIEGQEPVLKLPLVLISWGLWTFIPFIIGLLRFRRINLLS